MATATDKFDDLAAIKFIVNLLTGRRSLVYVIQVDAPLTWDDIVGPIPELHQLAIIDRMRRAALKKYAACRVEHQGPELVKKIGNV